MFARNGIFYTDFKGTTGKQIRVSTGTGNRQEALRIQKEIKEAHFNGKVVTPKKKPPGMTLREGFDKAERTIWKTLKSASFYVADASLICEIMGGDLLLSKISNSAVANLKEKLYEKGYATATVNNKLMCLSSMLKAAATVWEEIEMRPYFALTKPRNRRMRLISKAEEIQALQLADPELGDLLIVLMETGMRLGEVLKLRQADILLDERIIRILDPKVEGGDRAIPITERCVPVFTRRPDGFTSTKDSLEKRFAKIRNKMGLEGDRQFVMHTYRHTFGTRALAMGIKLEVVQYWMGHEDIASTQRYAKMTTTLLQDAKGVLDSGFKIPDLKVVGAC